ncbi:hypothetical protein [Candidatus Nitrosacidococcus tergens]|uniref:NnrS family protein n=1 Tax=Candidatus Nitrosacidococcus tergens TaxID=553981 RepID=A0A7G1Q843_9GAMM|nr:hypothetical protein [Candidatus Nitrosacidococcus tergens]CAB1274758.1 conserved membrane protein of unknown function [Candidatus Nitrosacidococcus tergens]
MLIKYFTDLCLFKAGPSDAPVSWRVFYQVLGVYMGVGWLISLLHLSPMQGLFSISIDTAIIVGLTWGLLSTKGYRSRLLQTLIALVGSGVIFKVLALFLLVYLKKATQQAGFSPDFILSLLAGHMVWSVMVKAYIFRDALTVSLTMGILITIVYVSITVKLMSFIFPSI